MKLSGKRCKFNLKNLSSDWHPQNFVTVMLHQLVLPKMMQHNSLSYFCCSTSPCFLRTTHNTVVFCLLFESHDSHEFEGKTKERNRKVTFINFHGLQAVLKILFHMKFAKNAQDTIPSLTHYLIFNSITNSAAVMLMDIVKLRCWWPERKQEWESRQNLIHKTHVFRRK